MTLAEKMMMRRWKLSKINPGLSSIFLPTHSWAGSLCFFNVSGGKYEIRFLLYHFTERADGIFQGERRDASQCDVTSCMTWLPSKPSKHTPPHPIHRRNETNATNVILYLLRQANRLFTSVRSSFHWCWVYRLVELITSLGLSCPNELQSLCVQPSCSTTLTLRLTAVQAWCSFLHCVQARWEKAKKDPNRSITIH